MIDSFKNTYTNYLVDFQTFLYFRGILDNVYENQ